MGHDNTGTSPNWYVERVELEDLESGKIINLPCNQWIGAYVDLTLDKNLSIASFQPSKEDFNPFFLLESEQNKKKK